MPTATEKFAEALVRQPKPLYRILASLVGAMENCRKTGNEEWLNRHGIRLFELVQRHLVGAGIDAKLYVGHGSSQDKLIFNIEYENSEHRRVTSHLATVTPSLAFDFHLRVCCTNGSKDRDGTNEYLRDVLSDALSEQVPDV